MVPFHYGSIVSEGDFCGRANLLNQIAELIESGQNVVLQGEHRVGKSSLIREAIRRQAHRQGLFINLTGIKTVDDICRAMLYGLLTLECKGPFFEKLLSSFSYLRPQLGTDPMTGQRTVAFDATVTLKVDAVVKIQTLIRARNQEKPLVVILDEFQETQGISEAMEAVEELSSHLQQCPEIPCIFSGSARNGLAQMFSKTKTPFGKTATTITVQPLPFKEFAPFLKARFKRGDRSISTAALKKIFAVTERVPGDIQQLCEALWAISSPGDSLKEDRVVEAIQLIFGREQSSYEIIISRLRANQMKVLQALSLLGGKAPTASKFVRSAGVAGASTVKQSLESLASQKIVYHANKEWRLSNPFFRAWILHRFIVPGDG